MGLRNLLSLALVLSVTACGNGIYLRDGVTDGDTFYLSQRALMDDDPVLQSWVSYSLTRSACQLQMGGENPARASSFDCELSARKDLLDTWREKKQVQPVPSDSYLDTLLAVRDAGYLGEYVDDHFGRRHWSMPGELETREYERWMSRHYPRHRAQTRLTGSWNYASNVRAD